MKLYYKPGACSLAAHIVMNEVKAHYQIEDVDTHTGRTASGADYRRINPRGYVPALVLEDGAVITENIAVLIYLADQFPDQNLAPAVATRARTHLLEILSFISSELHKAFTPFFASSPLSDAGRADAEAQISRQVNQIEAILADGRSYLVGTDLSVADIYAFVVLNWATLVGLSLAPWPHTTAFMARIAQRPSVHLAQQQEGLIT